MDHLGGRDADILRFVRKKHRGQYRAGRVPAWHHVSRVARVLDEALKRFGEGSAAERRQIVRAAYGHDLIEDTDAVRSEIRALFGDRGCALIEGMTNDWGDRRPKPYVAKVVRAEEAVRLTKLADLFDNCASAAYNFRLLGPRWARTYFLPIVEPMYAALRRTRFRKYRKTAAYLMGFADAAMVVFRAELEFLEEDKR